MSKEWKPTKEFSEKYEVSSFGGVRNCITKRDISLYLHPKGYVYVSLYFKGKRLSRRVHKLVMEAFSEKKDGQVINHINRDRADNRLENLEYISVRENVCHGFSIKNSYVGITFSKPKQKWQARITVDGKRKFLGHFPTEKQAGEAYISALTANGVENKYV
jgi:hypothetical protein